MTTLLYARVSTTDQTLAHQRSQAEGAGFQIDEAIADEGMSGLTTRLYERPQGRRLFDMLRRGDTLVVRWVDRLGRNYEDVCDTIREFMRRGVVIRTVISNFTFDGAERDPVRKAIRDALIAFMAALSEAQAEANKEAQRAGIEHARRNGTKTGKPAYRGRKPSYTRQQLDAALALLGQGRGTSDVAREAKLSRQTVLRIKANPAEAHRIAELWGV
jgi:putative DNA-invertase from lambdoid prophage Rac